MVKTFLAQLPGWMHGLSKGVPGQQGLSQMDG